MPKHLIYIAGPYRAPDRAAIARNIANARAIAVHAAAEGWFPVCPHLNTAHMEDELAYPDEYWLAGTMLLMEKCAAVVLVPGWQNSTGTLAEIARAKQLGIPVFTNHKFLIAADEFHPEPTHPKAPAQAEEANMSVTKERPILFCGAMVRAILDGRKTVTRRALRTQPVLNGSFWELGGAGWSAGVKSITPVAGHSLAYLCPYGQPGERLWVRETTEADEDRSETVVLSRYAADSAPVLYAGRDDPEYNGSSAHWDYPRRSRPSIHMPRWACRILLEITDVRIERLQGISEKQAEAEGVNGEPCDHARQTCSDIGCWGDTAKGAFGFLWESLNGQGSWGANPWVWVVEFKRIEQ